MLVRECDITVGIPECKVRSVWSLLPFMMLSWQPHPDDLLDSLEMCQVSSFVQSIHHQCEGGGESEGVEEASQ